MSESSKMGLFGSKDDNTETTDENKEPVKSDETLHQRQAPYNIDSDSETYDTEALSIMDINDIIGIQAESASDSTLESEFAALSEVITDMKSEELASGMSGTLKLKKSDIGKCDRSGNIDSTEDKGTKKEDPHEDICKQIDDNKSSDSAGMAGINKSLQLIGEAYISEDSQETDINEIAGIGVTKSVNLSESLSALKNQGDKAATKNYGKTLLDDSEKIEPEQNIAVECSAERKIVAALDKPVETVIKPIEEDLKSVRIDKSADSIDSPATDVSTKQTETESKSESMDVASVFTQDVAESSLTEKSSCNKSEESETREKIETQTLPVKTVIEAEEPMEIDEPNEEVSKVETEKVDSAVTEEIVENKSRLADPVVAEEATIEAKTSPKPEICEESSNDQVLKASASDFGMEEAKARKMVNEELVQSTNSSKDEEISARKLQMETDESQPKESLAEKVETNSPVAKIVESLVETVEQTDIVADDNKPKTLLQIENFKQEMSPERVEEISEIKRHDILLVERAKVLDNEPMEVDDNTRYHKNEIDNKSVNASDLSINYVDIIEPVGDIVVQSKQSASKEPVDTGSNSRMNSSKNIEPAAIEANESAENETIVISSVTSDETSVALELSDNSAKIVDSILVVASKESASNKSIGSELEAPVETAITAEPMEIEDVTLKDNSKEELVVSVPKVIKKSLEVAEAVSNIIQGETSSVASEVTGLEDEKMEVDAGVKKKKEEDERSDIHRPDEASQELESSSVSIVQQVSAVEEKLMIEKAGDTDRIENTENEEKTIEETVKIPRESMVDERREIETAKSIDETDETRQESKEKENVFVSERSDSSTEKSTRIKVMKATPEATNEIAEDKENSMKLEAKETNLLISTEAPDKALKKNLEEDKTVLQVSIEKAESLSQSDEIKTPETPVSITEQNVEGERDELAAITKEEEKEAPVSIKKNIESEKEEKEEAETSSTKSPMPKEDSLKRTREIKSTETTDEPIFKDMKDGNEEIDSESTQLKNKSSICTAATAEVLEKLETIKTQEEAEESSSITLENETKSHFVFSKPEAPQQETSRSDLLSSSMNVDDVEGEEDPVEEEMNLSLDPDNTECEESGSQEDGSEEAQRNVELSLEGMSVDAKKIEKQVDINLSLDSEGTGEELPRVQEKSLEKLIVDGSANETTVTFVAEKPEVEDDDNSKDILSTMIREPEIFHDEQSQNTQEMMDSILETDSCNFNKILDDEEGASAAFVCANDLPLEEAEINELADKLPSESEELLNKALDDPMSSQNTDSLEGLLDLDLIQEEDESTLKSVDPIVAKVMNEAEDDEEIERKDVDVSLLLEETNQGESVERDGFADVSVNADVAPKVVEEAANEISTPDENLLIKSTVIETIDSPTASQLVTAAAASVDNDIEATFELPSIEPNPLEADPLTSEERKLELTEDLLREIAVDEEKKMELSEKLLLESTVEKDRKIESSEELFLKITIEKQSNMNLSTDLLLQTAVKQQIEEESSKDILLTAAIEAKTDVESMEKVLMESPVPEDPKIELSEDILLEKVVRDEVSNVAAEIEDLPPNSEISELESAVKFLQESEEQGIDSSLVLSPKIVDSVVDEITRDEDVEMFVTDENICEDSTSLVAELGIIIPDPIAISEAEIISEAAKLENERKTKLSEEAKIQSPFSTRIEERKEDTESTPPPLVAQDALATVVTHPETPKTHREPRETVAKSLSLEKVEQSTLLKKSAPIPKISILEERLKEPPKIEIPSVSEVPRMCEMPTTPKTSLLIERDAKFSSFQKMLESPKASDKSELKIVENPRKDADKHEFESVGSPRIILKIAKSAIADCGEPRSPKSPKIRSATNSPNPEDSPGQKLGKIKLKLSKSGHPSIISNDNVEEVCGQWYTEGTSSLSPLGMKIKFSKTGDASIVQTEKHEFTDETKEQPKHKFEEAKRTESPIGMKIKFSKTGDASIVQQEIKETTSKHKDKLEMMQGSPKRNESPIGMKIKFSKSGDASIIQPDKLESSEDHREGNSRVKDKLEVPQDGPRRTESPLGMKFKLSKTRGSASIIPTESNEDVKDRLEVPDVPKRTESPLGMKIKFSKTGDASIIQLDDTKDIAKHKERAEGSQESAQHSDAPIGVKIKLTKTRDASTLQTDVSDEAESVPAVQKRTESSIGMKFKLSKSGDASIVHSEIQEHVEDSRSKEKMDNPQETPRKLDSPIGMKIKFSKTGDASIIQPQSAKKSEEPLEIEKEHQKLSESAPAMKIKSQRSGEASVADSEKRDKTARRKETDSPLEMKIKLSKTGHPTIVACDSYGESSQRGKDTVESIHKHKESTTPKEMPAMKMLKSMHGNRTELTIEPVQLQGRKSDGGSETAQKRKDVTISSIESKKAKLEAKFSQILPEVTIQPIMQREQKQIMFDAKASSISRQQMNVISQEISITQVRSKKTIDLSMTDKLKNMLVKKASGTNANADCEIIEHRPELIIVNENSNSSQDVMIIEEVPAMRGPDVKVPKKRGRPRRNPLPLVMTRPMQQAMMPTDATIPRDPLALDDVPQLVSQMTTHMIPQNLPPKENERPKRSCSRQKSYAPPRRGRGRGRGGGRGKRKMEMDHTQLSKKPRIDQDLDLIEQSTTALITIDEPRSSCDASQPDNSHSTSELYKALRQPPMDHKMANAIARVEAEQAVNDADLITKDSRESLMESKLMSHLDDVIVNAMNEPIEPQTSDTESKMNLESLRSLRDEASGNLVSEQMEKIELMNVDEKMIEKAGDESKDNKDTSNTQDHQNWLTPSSKKQLDVRNEGNNISSVQVIDEETRMSAESNSRSQTPARNLSLQPPETIVNEESQGSVLSTATTESEKVKVKNRRMEINFDPDEGPFTVDKVAEYEWPPDPTRKSETFMIQEQISHYLGVKSFKRKYPDLKRRMVDMEERNYLRENALVSEAMCDMGLTAVSSSEVLDVMCNDFPDQYEEYRKYIREKQMKEHSKKQKELTAAANAERNRIDLAEMAVQSALSWNVGLNKARRESRKCSLDLQTFTIHVPKKQQKVEEESRQSHYPVTLIPGQYTDYYREYTPAELRYYPLNTVLYGPMKPNERKLDSQSEGSQSDSDSDSSSDDSSSSSSDGTQDTEESQSTMDEVDVELSRQKEDIKSIKCKMCLKHLNKFSKTEVLIQCGTCNGYVHPSCIDLTLDMVPHIQAYAWQCTDCKTCAQCHDPADEDKMLFCDMCDRGYHIYCVGLRRVPQGRWHCQECAVCASCGSREAGGTNSDRNSVAQWQHEYKKGDKNTRVYVSTLCVPCSKLWRKGRYCPHCSRCHTVPRLDLEANLVHCSACDKYLHLGCVETKDLIIDRKHYLCDFCQPNRQQMVKPLVSKVFKT